MKAFLNGIILIVFVFLLQTSGLASKKQDPAEAARQVLRRIIERSFDQKSGKEKDSLLNAYLPRFKLGTLKPEKGKDVFELEAKNGKVHVNGSSTIAITRGIYHYFRYALHSQVAWSGMSLRFPVVLPDFPETRIVTPYEFRLYYNVCAFGYTTAFWDWEQWEKEIDWMALHGINMPLAMAGQEAIWQKLWMERGISGDELKDYFTGPAFLPWHRMGNVNKHDGPLPQSYIDKSKALQKKILARMRELGMEPVVPAFSGYVPKSVSHLVPASEIIPMKAWVGFPSDCNTFMLSPLSPAFKDIGKSFIEAYRKEYGEFHYYLSDAFNEMEVPVSKDGRFKELADFGKAIYSSIHEVDPKGTWVMQGWLFYNDARFWDKPSVQALLKDVPDDKMMIIDLANESWHGWEKHDGFYGKQWIYSIIHNYGGHNQWFGNLPLYGKDPATMLSNPKHGNLRGFGISPEGTENNEVVYEFLTDMMWTGKALDPLAWLDEYCLSRYGFINKNIKHTWYYLLKSVLSNTMGQPTNIYQRRPGRRVPATGLDTPLFRQAVESLMDSPDTAGRNDLFRRDAMELTAQYSGNAADFFLTTAIEKYKLHDTLRMKSAFDKAFSLMLETDALLSTLPQLRLERWLDFARKWATTPEEALYYEADARRQVTTWGGPDLSEYAAKMWSGLIRDYYMPRWYMYSKDLVNQRGLDIKRWESSWITSTEPVSGNRPVADPYRSAWALIQRTKQYKADFAASDSLPPAPVVDKILSYKATVILIDPPDANYKGKGPESLTDGIAGDDDFKDGNWLGFQAVDMEAVIDLGKERLINSISAGFLEDNQSWIYAPLSVEYSLSRDGEKFSSIGEADLAKTSDTEQPHILTYTMPLGGNIARYIKVKAKNTAVCPPWHPGAGGKAWLFCDEITVE